MNGIATGLLRKHRDDMKHEIVAQVHSVVKKEIPNETTHLNAKNDASDATSDARSESNRTYTLDENKSVHTPSRDVSVDEEAQINSKIITLIESEIKRDVNKQAHFSDSRPQSLSFYEDERMPEELSGNLELLSPEERKHYKKRKEHLQMDTDDRNAYNAIQDLYNQEDEIISKRSSKSRKKRHGDGGETGMGDSREMMIPKEKRKSSKKKKRENSPLLNGKKKHKKRDDVEGDVRGEIQLALEELQDDVFENNHEEIPRPEKIRKSPRRSERVYVQKKGRFEQVAKGNMADLSSTEGDTYTRQRGTEFYPIEMATLVQGYWRPFANLCQGLLGGMALAHLVFLRTNYKYLEDFIVYYANFCDIFVCLFYFLCVVCLISVFDRYDVAHLDCVHIKELIRSRKSAITILLYIICMLLHLSTAQYDDKIALVAYNNETAQNITEMEMSQWYDLSIWRASLAFAAWMVSGLATGTDMLYLHLRNMEKYIIAAQ